MLHPTAGHGNIEVRHDPCLCGVSQLCPECVARKGDAYEDPGIAETGTQDTGLRTQDTDPPPPEHCVSVSGGAGACASVSHPVPEFLRAVWEAARTKPRPAIAARYLIPAMRSLVALCHELQIAAGTGTFFLGCRQAGALIGADYHAVSRWLHRLERDGVLQRVSTGAQATRRANEYRYTEGQS